MEKRKRGRPRKRPEESRIERVEVKLLPEEKERLLLASMTSALTVSDILREGAEIRIKEILVDED